MSRFLSVKEQNAIKCKSNENVKNELKSNWIFMKFTLSPKRIETLTKKTIENNYWIENCNKKRWKIYKMQIGMLIFIHFIYWKRLQNTPKAITSEFVAQFKIIKIYWISLAKRIK